MCLTLKIMILIQPLYQLLSCIKCIKLFFFFLSCSLTLLWLVIYIQHCVNVLPSSVTSKNKVSQLPLLSKMFLCLLYFFFAGSLAPLFRLVK